MKWKKYPTPQALAEALGKCLKNRNGQFEIEDVDTLVHQHMDTIVFNAYFSTDEVRSFCIELIRKAASLKGVVSRSILPVYLKMGRGEIGGFTVPAFNIRLIPYETMRTIFQKAKETSTTLFIFEIARSEISYTAQPPELYAACVLASALKENYTDPVFIQGDHFQVNASRYRKDPDQEMKELKDLIKRAVEGGMRNIDIDCSTVVDEGASTPLEEQRLNAALTAELISYARGLEGAEKINLGGEIGEIGKRNSTPEDFEAFMTLLKDYLGSVSPEVAISKISVQTGTRHGGVILPDGSIAEVNVDFSTLREISALAREKYSMAGAVQHGASTLPVDMFDKFPEVGTAEIHLATQFMNMVMDSPYFPEELRTLIRETTFELRGEVRKNYETDEQFFISNRKFTIGYLAEDIWKLDDTLKRRILEEIGVYVYHIFTSLKVVNTKTITDKLFRST